MIRVIIIAFIIYLFCILFNKLFSKSRAVRRGTKTNKDVLDEMVQDPFCKVYIPKYEAIRKVIKGNEYFFCSKECATRFEHQLKEKSD